MQEYKAKYPELIRLIFHEKNLGLGGARNTGIKAAKGEYLMFIDSDDWVTLDAAEKFYSCALENNADLVICTCMYQNKNNYKKQPDNFYPYYFPPNIPINYFAPLYLGSVFCQVLFLLFF
jgi:glycosyltransferase involved in cell wall biosynthesis